MIALGLSLPRPDFPSHLRGSGAPPSLARMGETANAAWELVWCLQPHYLALPGRPSTNGLLRQAFEESIPARNALTTLPVPGRAFLLSKADSQKARGLPGRGLGRAGRPGPWAWPPTPQPCVTLSLWGDQCLPQPPGAARRGVTALGDDNSGISK